MDAVEIPSDQTGRTASKLFLLLFLSENGGACEPCEHTAVRNSRARPARSSTTGSRKSPSEKKQMRGPRFPRSPRARPPAAHLVPAHAMPKLYNSEPGAPSGAVRSPPQNSKAPRLHLAIAGTRVTLPLPLTHSRLDRGPSHAAGVRLSVAPGVRDSYKSYVQGWPWRSRRTSWR